MNLLGLLPQHSENELRRTFNALYRPLTVPLSLNSDPLGRRQRMPVCGTMTFGGN